MSIGNKKATERMKSIYQKFLTDNDKVDIYSTRKYFYEGYNHAQSCIIQEIEKRIDECLYVSKKHYRYEHWQVKSAEEEMFTLKRLLYWITQENEIEGLEDD